MAAGPDTGVAFHAVRGVGGIRVGAEWRDLAVELIGRKGCTAASPSPTTGCSKVIVTFCRRRKLQERLAKLAGGVAIIRVGGSTEVEVKEKKDRVEDALHSTRAAVEEGIVPGGGVALLRAKAAAKALKSENDDVQAGINIVLKALEAPIRQIAENSGVEGSIVVGRITDNKSQTFGFNAQTEEYVDMFGGHRRSRRGCPCRAPKCRVRGWLARHDGGHDLGGSQEGERSGDAGRRWHGRHGWNGLLVPTTRPERRAPGFPGPSVAP